MPMKECWWLDLLNIFFFIIISLPPTALQWDTHSLFPYSTLGKLLAWTTSREKNNQSNLETLLKLNNGVLMAQQYFLAMLHCRYIRICTTSKSVLIVSNLDLASLHHL